MKVLRQDDYKPEPIKPVEAEHIIATLKRTIFMKNEIIESKNKRIKQLENNIDAMKRKYEAQI